MNLLVWGHNSDSSDFEQPNTDQDCQLAEIQTQMTQSQPMEHPNKCPGSVTGNSPDQNEIDVSQSHGANKKPFKSQRNDQLLYMNDVVALIQTVVTCL